MKKVEKQKELIKRIEKKISTRQDKLQEIYIGGSLAKRLDREIKMLKEELKVERSILYRMLDKED